MPIKSRSHQSHHQKTAALLISRQPVCLSSTNPWRAASHSNGCEGGKKKKSAISALWIFHGVPQSRVAADRLSDVTSARSLRENSICSDNLSVTSGAFKELSPPSTSYYNSLKFSLNHRTRQHRTTLFFYVWIWQIHQSIPVKTWKCCSCVWMVSCFHQRDPRPDKLC